MRFPTWIAWLAGVALLGALIAVEAPSGLFAAFAALRWWLALSIAYHAVPILLDARAWQILFAPPPTLPPLVRTIWIGEGINGIFPVPHLGELARARIAQRLARAGEGVATVVVDLTLSVSTELIFALVGLALLSTLAGSIGAWRLVVPALTLVAAAAFAFYLLQRAGMFAIGMRIVHRWSEAARSRFEIGTAEALDRAVHDIYRRRGAILHAAAWRLAGWIAGAGETWILCHALGKAIGFDRAIAIESLGHAARTAAFVIPGGLGVQDGALMLLGSALGLGPDLGLVLALAKRSRELVLGLPALATAYALELRRFKTRRVAR
jgi:glycosyltransferase 2 family protein